MFEFQVWIRGLIVSLITGGAHTVSNCFVDPSLLQDPAAVRKIATMAGFSAFISVVAYLQKSPLPSMASHIDFSSVSKEHLENILKSAKEELDKRSTLTTNNPTNPS